MNLDTILDAILVREGGAKFTENPDDPPTKFGVTPESLAEYYRVDESHITRDMIKNLPEEEARDVYRMVYCIRPCLVRITNFDVLELAIDGAVQHGPLVGVQLVQRAARVSDDGDFGDVTEHAVNTTLPRVMYAQLLAARVRHYGKVITANPKKSLYAGGWMKRISVFVERQIP